ncbi:MAG: hypothetical protein ACKV22_38165 [Bryobacteraceae bacterium]
MASIEAAGAALGAQQWELPPLILHPFSDQSGPTKLLESSRASLMLNGMLPFDDSSKEELTQRLLEGRLCEIRMLFFVGKDLFRWIQQCVEFVERDTTLAGLGIRGESFADLLIQDPPANVQTKLRRWGVLDYRSIFSRAMGLNAVFSDPPDPNTLTLEFIRHYYRYADHLFSCRQQLQPFTPVTSANFAFEIYASGEYSRMLEESWQV